jgi:large subunit ribosomal protein L6
MSRIGKKPIDIPKDVTITCLDEKVMVKGKHGTLEQSVSNSLDITQENNKLIISILSVSAAICKRLSPVV